MATFKHYLPAAQPGESDLLLKLAQEHPKELSVDVRRSNQIFFEVASQALAGFVWYLLAKLRSEQRKVEDTFRRVAATTNRPDYDSDEACKGEDR